MPPAWQTGIVQSIIQETPNCRRFLISVVDQQVFSFEPGQFVTLDLPIHEKPARRWRSYSIASAPDGSNQFELLVSLVPGGAGTDYLFKEIKEGSELLFRGPQGVFLLPSNLDRDLFMICTGTGIAPFRAMLHSIFDKKIPHRDLYLIFGCRHKEDLLYYEEFRRLSDQYPSFHYLPVLSREKWEGHTGYVHSIYEEICRQKNLAGPHAAHFYLCGWKNMITEARQRLTAMGFDRKDIRQELYG